jgi:hypothetical protein
VRSAWTVDTQLLWDILIYEKSGVNVGTSYQTLLGNTLIPRDINTSDREDAEFDLIGSVGIYGHRAMHKETPIYAPNEPTPPLDREEYPDERQHQQLGVDSFNDIERSHDDLFMGAFAYGQDIEAWMEYGGL